MNEFELNDDYLDLNPITAKNDALIESFEKYYDYSFKTKSLYLFILKLVNRFTFFIQ